MISPAPVKNWMTWLGAAVLLIAVVAVIELWHSDLLLNLWDRLEDFGAELLAAFTRPPTVSRPRRKSTKGLRLHAGKPRHARSRPNL
ncbi:MAG: hypothetical protein ACKOZT_08765 [Cyanobium sp.]